LAFFLLLWTGGEVYAQQTDSLHSIPATAPTDTVAAAPADSIPGNDSLRLKTTEDKEKQLGIRISKESLPAVVTTTAKDSAVLNVKEKVFYLYGDAQANYEDLQIKSGTLVYHQQSNLLMALPALDTAGKKISTQEFKQGEQIFTYDTLKYNFKSKRAIVRNAHSQYGDGFVISEQVKRNPDESIYGYHSLYTTCNLDHPHFGIKASKIKVIPGRIIAAGPANLQIMDIPTPLFLPFGMFPITEGQHSGFIVPAYTLEATRGLGLQNGGYYFAINDYLGMTNTFDYYSKGSWASRNTMEYAYKYHYNGNFRLNYSYTLTEANTETNSSGTTDFQVHWEHHVDPKATPSSTFSASVDFGTSSYNRINQVDLYNKLQNTYQSNIAYGKTWKNKPYSFTAALRHSQNTGTGLLTITLPELSFNLGQFSPFQRKNMIGMPKWYEKITVSYYVNATNIYNTYDSLFSLRNIAFNDMNNAMRHTIQLGATYNVFRFFNWNVSVPLTEYWNTKQLYTYYNSATRTTDSVMKTGFFASRTTGITSSLNTSVYGMLLFKKGKIAGIRHVLRPDIGFSYTPGYSKPPFDYLYNYNVNPGDRPDYRTPYSVSPYGPTSLPPMPGGSITYGIQNTLQMKVRNTDSLGNATTKNISLIDQFSIRGSYNLFADSLNMSDFNVNFSTNILNKINLSAYGTFTPYVNRRESGQYLLSAGKGLVKMVSGGVNLGVSFQADKKNTKETEDAKKGNDEVNRLLANGGYNNYYDFSIPWNVSIAGGLTVTRQYTNLGESLLPTPSLSITGGFNLTERWKVSYYMPFLFNGFKKVSINNLDLNISRDLHCWQMSLHLIPVGPYRSFSFLLQVKSTVLQDLKLTKKRSQFDNNAGF